jgi:hypothetical protein
MNEELMDKITDEIMEVSDKYKDYISGITISWKEGIENE